MPDPVLRFLSVFQCPACKASEPEWRSSGGARPFRSDGHLLCRWCEARYLVRQGYLDLHPGTDEPVTPIQRLMQFPPAVAIYEGLWRPMGYFIASQRSFSRDADRLASFIQPGHRIILDLACGPGTVTRRLARMAPDALVIGLDLSPQMLERAVRLAARERLDNIYYLRGSALSLPFMPEVFDAVTCCGALQLFTDQDRAVGEIARVLRIAGDFVCQTTLGPKRPPMYVRLADRMLKFGYFYLDDLKDRLSRFEFDLKSEERSNINYIFRAARSRSPLP
jgi:ubiquinone/menaquinone biosynthesis C-methylase UbiE